MDRRALLAGLGGLVASTALSQSRLPPRHVAPEIAGYFNTQLHHLEHVDALAGPHLVLDAANSHYRTINWLLDATTGQLHTDLLRTASSYAQLAGWLHLDAGDPATASMWSTNMLEMAHRAGDSQLVSFALGFRSQLRRTAGDQRGAAELADASLNASKLAPKAQAHSLVQVACAHAVRGDRTSTERSLDPVADLIDAADDEWAWGNTIHTPSWVDAQWALCYQWLGLHTNAIHMINQVMAKLPDDYHRDRGIFLAMRARTHLANSEPAAAADDTTKAIGYLDRTGSATTHRELTELRADAAGWSATAEGRDLVEVLDAVA